MLLFLVFAFFNLCSGYKILLVFPLPGSSHVILGEGFVRHLLEAGHEVTYITPVPYKKPMAKLRQIDVSENFNVYPLGEILNLKLLMTKEVDMTDMSKLKIMMNSFANATVTNPNVKKLLEDPREQFDVVIAEWMYTEIYSGFSVVLKCPLIWSSSMDPHAMVLWLIHESPNPAYIADHMSNSHPPFTFWQRAKELWTYLRWIKYEWSSRAYEKEIYQAGFSSAATKRGVTLTPLVEAKYNASLMLGNSHVSLGQPMSLPQNYKPILGYHIKKDIEPLPESIQKIMDDAKHGVIYFSMGSMLKSKTFPDVLKKDLLDIFRGLKQTVIWKFEEGIPDLPKNVHILSWVPQQSVLAHPNCVLFITHGGLLSMTETVHFGVPIIGIPMFADQFLNADRAVVKGFGLKVHLDWDLKKNLQAAIEEILGNPRYRETVKELSFIYHHRTTHPGAELVHWTEHVVLTRGAPHLRSPALRVPFYQKHYLDLAAAIALIIILAVKILKYMCSKKNDIHKKTN